MTSRTKRQNTNICTTSCLRLDIVWLSIRGRERKKGNITTEIGRKSFENNEKKNTIIQQDYKTNLLLFIHCEPLSLWQVKTQKEKERRKKKPDH